jgi:hypothetical protein
MHSGMIYFIKSSRRDISRLRDVHRLVLFDGIPHHTAVVRCHATSSHFEACDQGGNITDVYVDPLLGPCESFSTAMYYSSE